MMTVVLVTLVMVMTEYQVIAVRVLAALPPLHQVSSNTSVAVMISLCSYDVCAHACAHVCRQSAILEVLHCCAAIYWRES